MTHYIAPVFLSLLLMICSACSSDSSRERITREIDYKTYLLPSREDGKLNAMQQEIDFWQSRLDDRRDDPASQIKLASALSKRFNYSGQIEDLHRADSLLHLANRLQRNFSSGVYRSLAKNAITRHRFRDARNYIDTALLMRDDLYASRLMAFDVALELGNVEEAGRHLEEVVDKESFDHLIRAARFSDHHHGDLDGAIRLMEKALDKIEETENDELICWAKTNLGDMYGHANRYEDAYRAYLEVLALNRDSYHALKGIAWLAYAHDRDTKSARHILNRLKQRHPIPDYDLLLAEIAAYENDEKMKTEHLLAFTEKATNPLYDEMYNQYLFDLYTDETHEISKAADIAKIEVAARPTPVSYHMLAWAEYKSGNATTALDIIKKQVEGRCFEPAVVLRMGEIYKANGQDLIARRYLEEASESAFELGPVAMGELVNW